MKNRFYLINVDNLPDDVNWANLTDEEFKAYSISHGCSFNETDFVRAFNDDFISTSSMIVRIME